MQEILLHHDSPVLRDDAALGEIAVRFPRSGNVVAKIGPRAPQGCELSVPRQTPTK